MKASDYKDTSTPEEITESWDVINASLEEIDKKIEAVENEIDDMLFSMSMQSGNKQEEL